MRVMQGSEEGGGTHGCKTLLECRGERVRYECNVPDPLASGECHAQEGTRALPGQRQRTGGEETPTGRAWLRGCPEDLLSIGRKQHLHNFRVHRRQRAGRSV